MHARPTLIKLVRLSDRRDSLPEYCVVYGVHCSGDRLRIIAHFPLQVKGEDEDRWEFAQVMVAEHWNGLADVSHMQELVAMHVDDNAIVNRWRISVALFTIRDRIQCSKEIIKTFQPDTLHPNG